MAHIKFMAKSKLLYNTCKYFTLCLKIVFSVVSCISYKQSQFYKYYLHKNGL